MRPVTAGELARTLAQLDPETVITVRLNNPQTAAGPGWSFAGGDIVGVMPATINGVPSLILTGEGRLLSIHPEERDQ